MYVKIEKVYDGENSILNKIKFSTDREFSSNGIFSKDSDPESDTIRQVLAIEGIIEVFVEKKSIVIEKSEDIEWGIIKPQVLGVIMDSLDEVCPSEEDSREKFVPTTEMEIGIEKILNERIVPAIKMDGGDLEFLGVEDNVVKVKLKGACVGCPSSNVTLKNGIERALKHYFPTIVSVENMGE